MIIEKIGDDMGKILRRTLLSLASIFLIFFSCQSARANVQYIDMKGHWSNNYVQVVTDSNIMNGYTDGTFKPNNNITRAEFYRIINQLAELKKTYTVTFQDVKKSDWFYNEVAKGIKAGYILPTTGNLNPNRDITRQEAMYIIGFMYELAPIPEEIEVFGDKDLLKEETKGYVGALCHYGIVNGYPDGNFKPNDPITRGEISKIINLLFDKLQKPSEKVLMDSEIVFETKDYYD
ncbi:MAG: S-layer homology domain-containing protein [Tissierellia bacterium]|nr:S-layer homology domain-containing protein [Tissierellia bacterium]